MQPGPQAFVVRSLLQTSLWQFISQPFAFFFGLCPLFFPVTKWYAQVFDCFHSVFTLLKRGCSMV
jgi:hypothetical protein